MALPAPPPARLMARALLPHPIKDKDGDLIAEKAPGALIPTLPVFVREDDRHYFPPYESVPIIRQQTLARHPGVKQALDDLAGKISDDDMRQLNYAVDGQKRDVKEVVQEFLKRKGL